MLYRSKFSQIQLFNQLPDGAILRIPENIIRCGFDLGLGVAYGNANIPVGQKRNVIFVIAHTNGSVNVAQVSFDKVQGMSLCTIYGVELHAHRPGLADIAILSKG